jgi:RNA polymerase sigma-70 factor (ECF subfamily)
MAALVADELLAAAQAGNPAAIETLLEAHRHGVYRYGLRVCPTTEDAEDAVQITLWAATRSLRSFRGGASSLVSWMFTIVRRECLRLLERGRRAPRALAGTEDAVVTDADDPERALDERRRTALLAAALGSLDPADREVLLLRDVEELSAPEAATRLGVSVPALKSRLHRARARLREQVLARAPAERLRG